MEIIVLLLHDEVSKESSDGTRIPKSTQDALSITDAGLSSKI